MQCTRPPFPTVQWLGPLSEERAGPRILGINPWIYDFAAYNLWLRPLGLLVCLRLFRRLGSPVALLDCLDRTWDEIEWPQQTKWGSGRFPKTEIPGPASLADFPRVFSRYGLPYEAVEEALLSLHPKPDAVFLTSLMTYWYPGVFAAAYLVRKCFPDIPIILGGVYASLCPEHARSSGLFDLVVEGALEAKGTWEAVTSVLGMQASHIPEDAGYEVESDFYPRPEYAPVLGSRGCPFHCDYCSGHSLYPDWRRRKVEDVLTEMEVEYEKGVRNFAFFDDALLVDAEHFALPLFHEIRRRFSDINLHTPNALHVRFLTSDVCAALYHAGLKTIRLGVETLDFSHRNDTKLDQEEFESGIQNLFAVGCKPQDIGVYLLYGLPGQDEQQVIKDIGRIRSYGFKPFLSYYTPIPKSTLFSDAISASTYDLKNEPLYQNNSLWPCVPGGFTWEKRAHLQDMLRCTGIVSHEK